MKKILVTILVVVGVMSVNAQERVNRQNVDFIESSEILTSAIGWSYNGTIGEWVDYNNCICYDKSFKDKYKILCNSSYQKVTIQILNRFKLNLFYTKIQYITL